MTEKRYVISIRTVDRSPCKNYVFETLANLERSGLFRSSISSLLTVFDSGSPRPGNEEYWRQVEEHRRRRPEVLWNFTQRRLTPNENATRALQFAAEQDCEWVVFLEDDIDVGADFLEGLSAWLRRVSRPDRKVYPLCANYTQVLGEFPVWDYPIKDFYGTQGYVLKREDAASAAVYLAAHPLYDGVPQGHDLLLKAWAKATWPEIDYFTAAAPNMIQHMGRESSLHLGTFHDYPSWRGRDWSFFRALTVNTPFTLAEQEHRPFSPRLAASLADYLPRDRPIHDLGCGTGLYVQKFVEAGHTAFGYDATPGINELAKVRVDEKVTS